MVTNRYLGKMFEPGVSVHPPCVVSFGAPWVGKLNDILNGVDVSSTTSIEGIDFYRYTPFEGNLARQLICMITDNAGGVAVTVTINGLDCWGANITETLSVTTKNAASTWGAVSWATRLATSPTDPVNAWRLCRYDNGLNNYPYADNATKTVPPGYETAVIGNQTSKTFYCIKDVYLSSVVPNGKIYLGRNNTFGLKYPALGWYDNTDINYDAVLKGPQRTDMAAFVLDEVVAEPISAGAAFCRKAHPNRRGRVIPGNQNYPNIAPYWGAATGWDARGTYQPYEQPLDPTVPSGDNYLNYGGNRGFLLCYVPSRIDTETTNLPMMFIETESGWGGHLPARSDFYP
jgi:hypothetical protein